MASSEASETKSIITGLLTSNPLRCTMRQLCDDFRNTVGYNIPIRKLGFSTVEEYLRSIPDTVHVFGSGPHAEVAGIIKQRSAHINAMVAKQRKDSIPAHKRRNIKVYHEPRQPRPSFSTKYKKLEDQCEFNDEYRSRIPKMIQNNLRKLILQFPDGIWCTKLPAEYRKMFREDLCYGKYNYRSLIEMCSDLPEIFRYINPTTDDFILYEKNKAIPSVGQNEPVIKKDDTTLEIPDLDWSLGSALIRSDVVQFLEEIPRYNLGDIHVGDYLDINIGEICDIQNFWVYPKFSDFDKVMNELQSFFCAQRNRYVIPELFLEEGLYCTVFHKDKYHRCVIVDLLPRSRDFVKVLFIDYGSIGSVYSKEVWYLPKQFGNLPCQAIKARLSNIRSGIDSAQTVSKFIHLITRTELVAEIMKVDKKDLVLDIYLADITNQEHIFYINDALVEKGYAQYK